MSTTQGALSGIRVLDLSRILAGPWASQMLGDLGAEVIKVERPASGDDTRTWGPPFLRDRAGNVTEVAAYYLSANRNKKSITVDMAHPEGQALLQALVPHCDVVLENFKQGGLRQYGLDYEHLKKINPGLIYCSITGFGQTGPYKDQAGYDFLIQGMGGLMSLTGTPEGEEGAGPIKAGVALTDILTGLYAANAILAALVYRQQYGVGQHIDLGLLDVQVACLANQALNYLSTGDIPRRLGNAHPNIVPYEAFPTADGDMILAIGNDGQFIRFCDAAGVPELAVDSRFATNAMRVGHRKVLIPLLRRLTVQRTTATWVEVLQSCAVPCGPINNLAEVFADPQVQARGMQFSMKHHSWGDVPQVGNPIKMSATPVTYTLPPPALGEHTESVLAALLGLGAEAIGALQQKKVI